MVEFSKREYKGEGGAVGHLTYCGQTEGQF
jgi:hypothetical protein